MNGAPIGSLAPGYLRRRRAPKCRREERTPRMGVLSCRARTATGTSARSHAKITAPRESRGAGAEWSVVQLQPGPGNGKWKHVPLMQKSMVQASPSSQSAFEVQLARAGLAGATPVVEHDHQVRHGDVAISIEVARACAGESRAGEGERRAGKGKLQVLHRGVPWFRGASIARHSA